MISQYLKGHPAPTLCCCSNMDVFTFIWGWFEQLHIWNKGLDPSQVPQREDESNTMKWVCVAFSVGCHALLPPALQLSPEQGHEPGAWTCHQHASVGEETEILTCCNPAKFHCYRSSVSGPVLKMKWSLGFQPPHKRGSSAIFVMREFQVFKLRVFFPMFSYHEILLISHELAVFIERCFFRNINHGALKG